MHTFAYNTPSNITGLARDMLQMQQNADPQTHWMALVDHGFDYPNPFRTEWIELGLPLYARDVFKDVGALSPWLYAMHRIPPVQRHDWLVSLIEHCAGRPMLSFLHSRLPLSLTAEHLRQQALVKEADAPQERYLMRYADTRVLPDLHELLSPQHWRQITSPLLHWVSVHRTGRLLEIPLGTVDFASPYISHKPIELSSDELARMIDHALPDSMIDALVKAEQIQLNAVNGYSSHELARHACALAKCLNIEDMRTVLELVRGQLQTRGKLLQDRSFEDWLSKHKTLPFRFDEGIQNLMCQ